MPSLLIVPLIECVFSPRSLTRVLSPDVLRNRSRFYEPLIFSACMIEILARRLCCDNPSIFASFEADSSDTSPSWSFLSYWKEGLLSRNCVSPRLWSGAACGIDIAKQPSAIAMSCGFKLVLPPVSFRLLLQKKHSWRLVWRHLHTSRSTSTGSGSWKACFMRRNSSYYGRSISKLLGMSGIL